MHPINHDLKKFNLIIWMTLLWLSSVHQIRSCMHSVLYPTAPRAGILRVGEGCGVETGGQQGAGEEGPITSGAFPLQAFDQASQPGDPPFHVPGYPPPGRGYPEKEDCHRPGWTRSFKMLWSFLYGFAFSCGSSMIWRFLYFRARKYKAFCLWIFIVAFLCVC